MICSSTQPAPKKTTWKTVTLDIAKQAVTAYNEGVHGCVKNPDVDRQAREMFADRLGCTKGKIERQVEFIGQDYGGAGPKPFIGSSVRALAERIAADIFRTRTEYEQEADSAPPILLGTPSRKTIETLYRPFIREKNWLVWATKFWHFLNHDAFPIEDSRVDKFFELKESNPVDRYLTLCKQFREFALSHQEWLPELRQMDGGDACCDIKLWDKMCYGIEDLKCKGA